MGCGQWSLFLFLASIIVSRIQLYHQQYYPLMIKDHFVKYLDNDLKYNNPLRQLEINIYHTYIMSWAYIRNTLSIGDRLSSY